MRDRDQPSPLLPGWSVVIPTCERLDLLSRCLSCLDPESQGFAASDYEVIVTDDGVREQARSLIAGAFPWARWLPGPRRGPAANRNAGARSARGKWLLFTDDDCEPSRTWLRSFATEADREPSASLLEGRTIADRPQTRFDEVAPLNELGGNLWSCNFGILRSLFEDADGFDERFQRAFGEDVDLRLRLQKRGISPLFVAGAVCVHPFRPIQESRHIVLHIEDEKLLAKLHPDIVDVSASERLRQILRVLRFWFLFAWPYRFRGSWLIVARATILLREYLSLLRKRHSRNA